MNNPLPQPTLAVDSLDRFLFGRAPRPLTFSHGLEVGGGTVIPEINFTLPPMEITEQTWPEVRGQYTQMIEGVCRRAADLGAPGLLVEFETLPPMTVHPAWGAEITELLAATLAAFHEKHGLKSALRLTPNDNRDHERPSRLRSGPYWDGMKELFRRAGGAGAHLLAIESTGGKEVSDYALMNCDLRALVYALGVLAPRDMRFLWDEIVATCRETNVIPSGDTACGFANTAMTLAEQKLIPRVFAAVARVAAVPRSLVAYEAGAVGPSKDCAYEGPYMKAITGVPISMEGRSAACAHLSPLGNIAQAVCDCWSNESVQNVRLLSAFAPVVSVEQLTFDCRLMNRAGAASADDARRFRDWLVESDAGLDPQAWVLRPDVVLRVSREIMAVADPYQRTVRAVRSAVAELGEARARNLLRLDRREERWLETLQRQAEGLPDEEAPLIAEMQSLAHGVGSLPAEYGL